MLARRSPLDRLRMTHLCVPIFVTELEKARRDIAAALAAGADLVELRIDMSKIR